MKVEKLTNFTIVLLGVAFVLIMGNTSIKREIDEVENTIIGILS
jgi:hypothetical protein